VAKQTKLPFDVSDLDLTPLELKFVGVYCTESNFDETIAWKKTFTNRAKNMSLPEMRLEALDMLNKRSIKLAVQRFTDSVIGPWQDKLGTQLLTVLRTRSFYDISIFYHDDGSPRKLSDIPEEYRICIDGVLQDGKGRDGSAIFTTLKLGDRKESIKMLQDLLKKKEEIDDSVNNVPDEARQRIRDVFTGLEKGLAIANRLKNAPKRQDDDEVGQLEDRTSENVTMSVIRPQEDYEDVEADPMVVKAKELTTQASAGMYNESDLVDKAREIARLKAGIR